MLPFYKLHSLALWRWRSSLHSFIFLLHFGLRLCFILYTMQPNFIWIWTLFFRNLLKVRQIRNDFFQADFSSKQQMYRFDFITCRLVFIRFLEVFWKKVMTQKRHFEINWPLKSLINNLCRYLPKYFTCPIYWSDLLVGFIGQINQPDLPARFTGRIFQSDLLLPAGFTGWIYQSELPIYIVKSDQYIHLFIDYFTDYWHG